MTRNKHDVVNDHFGVLTSAQIAGGTATSGYVPTSNGDGTSTWAAGGGGGGSFSGARVYRTTDQTIPTGTQPAITFDAERYDTDSYHSLVTNTSRLTLPTTANYTFGCSIEAEALTGSGDLVVSIMINGSNNIATVRLPGVLDAAASLDAAFVLSTDWDCTAADYAEVKVFISAPTGDVISNPPRSPEFWVKRNG